MAVHSAITTAGPKVPMSEQLLTASTLDLHLNDSTYLGGSPGADPSRYSEALVAGTTQIGIGSATVAWADCTGVTIKGGDIEKSRVAATIMFGVAGLATKSSAKRVLVTVHKGDGTAAVFQVANAEAQVVSATARATPPKTRRAAAQRPINASPAGGGDGSDRAARKTRQTALGRVPH